MGTWGTGLFSSDMARDIRDFYRERIEDGIEDAEATRLTLEKFRSYLEDPEEGPVSLIALAVTQSKVGRLDPLIHDRALAALDRGADLATWEEESPKLHLLGPALDSPPATSSHFVSRMVLHSCASCESNRTGNKRASTAGDRRYGHARCVPRFIG